MLWYMKWISAIQYSDIWALLPWIFSYDNRGNIWLYLDIDPNIEVLADDWFLIQFSWKIFIKKLYYLKKKYR